MFDFINDILTGGESSRARKAGKKAVAAWEGLETPDYEKLDPEMFAYLGDAVTSKVDAGEDVDYEAIDPRLADIATMDGTAFDEVSVDPRLKDNQMASLGALDDIIQGGGMTLQDEANMAKLQSQVGQADRGRREAIQQSMAQRGMGGSGRELLQMLDSAQAATDRQAQGGLDVAAMAQQRALDSIMNSGNLSGQIRGQDFGEQATIADARDAINQFNVSNTNQGNQFNATAANNMGQFNAGNALQNDQFNKSNQIGVDQFNAASSNDMSRFNTQNRQGTANMNTALKNDTEKFNKYDIPTQDFKNKAGIAGGKSSAYTGQQQGAIQAGAGNKQLIGSGLIAGATWGSK